MRRWSAPFLFSPAAPPAQADGDAAEETDDSARKPVLPLVDMEQLRGKHVLIVEDVIQTGKTLQKVPRAERTK